MSLIEYGDAVGFRFKIVEFDWRLLMKLLLSWFIQTSPYDGSLEAVITALLLVVQQPCPKTDPACGNGAAESLSLKLSYSAVTQQPYP